MGKNKVKYLFQYPNFLATLGSLPIVHRPRLPASSHHPSYEVVPPLCLPIMATMMFRKIMEPRHNWSQNLDWIERMLIERHGSLAAKVARGHEEWGGSAFSMNKGKAWRLTAFGESQRNFPAESSSSFFPKRAGGRGVSGASQLQEPLLK